MLFEPLGQKFLEKEGALTLYDLLRIARSQVAVDRQLKQFSGDQMNNQANDQGNNQKNDQVNAVGGRSDGRKGKISFGCGQEGHFSGDKKCSASGRACRKCGSIGHFKVKCPQVQQRRSGELGSRAKFPDRKGATGGGRRGRGSRR